VAQEDHTAQWISAKTPGRVEGKRHERSCLKRPPNRSEYREGEAGLPGKLAQSYRSEESSGNRWLRTTIEAK